MKCPPFHLNHHQLCHTKRVGGESKSITTNNHSNNRPLHLTAHRLTCYTKFMTETATINRSHLISALYHEYQFLCHDDFDPDVDPTPDEYLQMLQSLSDDELVYEASADDIDEFITHWL